MRLQTVYFNFDNAVVTWYRPHAIDWERAEPHIKGVFDNLPDDLKDSAWIVQFRHRTFKATRWALITGEDPSYQLTLHFLRKELAVSVV